jgi:glutamine amidotransferase
MGWSKVTASVDSPFGEAGHTDYFYFVHSYAATDPTIEGVVATTDYGMTFPSLVIRDHLWGCQFHPEKSAASGIAFLAEFVKHVQSSTPARTAVATG